MTAEILKTGFIPEVIDLGEHQWGETIPLDLVFANHGTEPIVLRSASKSCGCTVLDSDSYKDRAVTPGQSISIKASLETEKSVGPKIRTVDLYTDLGIRYRAEIRLDVIATYVVTPESIDFGQISSDAKTPEASATIEFNSNCVLLVGSPTADVDWIRINADDSSNGQTNIHVSLIESRLPNGAQVGRVIFKTTDPFAPTCDVRVRAETINDLNPIPSEVYLADTRDICVRFFDRNGEFVPVTFVESTNASIATKITQEGIVAVHNPTGVSLSDTVAVYVRVDADRFGRVLVSTLP